MLKQILEEKEEEEEDLSNECKSSSRTQGNATVKAYCDQLLRLLKRGRAVYETKEIKDLLHEKYRIIGSTKTKMKNNKLKKVESRVKEQHLLWGLIAE